MIDPAFKHLYPSSISPPQISAGELVEHPDLRVLFSAWAALQESNELPSNPVKIIRSVKHLLKYVHLSDVVDNGADFRFRLLGDSVFPGLEKKQKGRLTSEHLDPGIAFRYGTLMQETVARRRPIRGVAERITKDENYNFVVESLWLPFGNNACVSQILSMARFTSVL